MKYVYTRFRWLGRPQLFVGFMIICLCMGGAGTSIHGGHPPLAAAAKGQTAAAASEPLPDTSPPPKPLPPPAPVDCALEACLALTFDDGPDPIKTPQILDILARNQVHATFFLVGREVPGHEDLVLRAHEEGHEIGNHSWNHQNFTQLSPTAMQGQIASTQAAIIAAGVPAPSLFRPPYGAVDASVKSHVGMPLIRWDIDTEDWRTHNAQQVTAHLINDAHPGGIVLMHDKYDATTQALEPALQVLKQHYHFVTISQLLDLSPGDQGQYFGRTP
jgi:peptidoglycan/xylan/chitin deacetylase (PgdA/CDA1 family)